MIKTLRNCDLFRKVLYFAKLKKYESANSIQNTVHPIILLFAVKAIAVLYLFLFAVFFLRIYLWKWNYLQKLFSLFIKGLLGEFDT